MRIFNVCLHFLCLVSISAFGAEKEELIPDGGRPSSFYTSPSNSSLDSQDLELIRSEASSSYHMLVDGEQTPSSVVSVRGDSKVSSPVVSEYSDCQNNPPFPSILLPEECPRDEFGLPFLDSEYPSSAIPAL